MNRLNKTEYAIFVSSTCSLLPGDLHLDLISKRRIKSGIVSPGSPGSFLSHLLQQDAT